MRIYHNGSVFTMNENRSICEAVVIDGDKIVYVGSNQEALAYASDGSELIDLEGKTVLPGFHDTHMHVLHQAFFSACVNLRGCKSMDEVIERCRDHMENNEMDYIMGMGWNNDDFESNTLPTLAQLDEISEDIPVYLFRSCGHMVVVNSVCMELMSRLQIEDSVQRFIDLEGGILREEATKLYLKILPKVDGRHLKDMLEREISHLNRYGITSIHSDDFQSVPLAKSYQSVIDGYKDLEGSGRLTIRVYEQCLLYGDEYDEFIEKGYRTERDSDNLFRIGPRKIWADGSLGSESALMTENYIGSDSKGIEAHPQCELNDMVGQSQRGQMQVAIHGIGDGAGHMIMTAYEENAETNPGNCFRHGIVHSQITPKDLIERMANFIVVSYVQPAFIEGDMKIIESKIGERAKDSYTWKSMMKAGVVVAGGSDYPVVSPNVMESIYMAVTRKNLEGTDQLNPEEGMELMDAIAMYTSNAAITSFDEGRLGMLKVGYKADLAVLDRDIRGIDEDILKDVHVSETVLNGQTVYKQIQEQ